MFLFLKKDFCSDLLLLWYSGILWGISRWDTYMHMKLCMYLIKLLERKEGREGGQETGRKQVSP